jgi:hypothetical protein
MVVLRWGGERNPMKGAKLSQPHGNARPWRAFLEEAFRLFPLLSMLLTSESGRVRVVGGANGLGQTIHSHSRHRSLTMTVSIPDSFVPFLTRGFRLFPVTSRG